MIERAAWEAYRKKHGSKPKAEYLQGQFGGDRQEILHRSNLLKMGKKASGDLWRKIDGREVTYLEAIKKARQRRGGGLKPRPSAKGKRRLLRSPPGERRRLRRAAEYQAKATPSFVVEIDRFIGFLNTLKHAPPARREVGAVARAPESLQPVLLEFLGRIYDVMEQNDYLGGEYVPVGDATERFIRDIKIDFEDFVSRINKLKGKRPTFELPTDNDLQASAEYFGYQVPIDLKGRPPEDLKQRYRKRAHQLHPDLGGNPPEFRRATEHYQRLRHHYEGEGFQL